ncbi:potassium transporter KefA [Vespertiliibacter pulmonis]|uniref:Potassium efflux system protein n=1 Tax=Vespertiliibacter pulmonis TaxID=1443036 RepID=A0A3N4W179_9PAST|nr:mechanosensitive channel MscK [Vespertiliibacter pulmonis]QLB20128.1 potassium transporter KefA [Vespertiliibacter pulmonis]RPE86099.1 potassium efflux system protein [Vespertiliibacter pulmonis]
MFKQLFLLFLALSYFVQPLQAKGVEDFVSVDDIRLQLEALKNNTNYSADEATRLSQNLEGALAFAEKAKKQQEDIERLEQKIKDGPKILNEYKERISQLKESLNIGEDFSVLGIKVLENRQDHIRQNLQQVQGNLTETSSSLANLRIALDQSRHQVIENNSKAEKLNKWKYNRQASKSLIDKYNAELKYLESNNRYNLMLEQNIDLLISIDEAKKTELSIKQQVLQNKLNQLQEILNANRLKEFQEQAKQAEQLKAYHKTENPIIQDELSYNTDLSQYLVEQTEKANKLSKDSLRAKNVLDALTQTKRNIEEQISALQGTLVLSRVIYQQKQNLPTESVIKDLAKDIAKLRVELFEFTQTRDELYNISNVIDRLQAEHKVLFDDEERQTLDNLLKEREKIVIDLVKILNAQLNQSNEIEVTQRQITELSDKLQRDLQQQSFWVPSNNSMDLSWLENFPRLALVEASSLAKYIGFENIQQNLPSKFAFLAILFLLYGLILWKKPAIKKRLSTLSSQVNTLKSDSHWHTPEAMIWTVVLALPSTLLFLIIATMVLGLLFNNPFVTTAWLTEMTAYWLFFATVLALLRPNGLAYRHFGMPQASNEIFQRIVRHSIWIIILLLSVTSVFSQVDSIDFSDDVIGQVLMIVALALCLFVVRPLLARGIQEYQNAILEDGTKRGVGLFKLLRLVLVIIPVLLIVLMVFGYYYTTIYIIEHIIKSYIIALIWVFGRYFAYRFLTISSRRMAYRRLQTQREKIREQILEQGKTDSTKETLKEETRENKIKISTVNQQIFRMADLIAWVLLFISLYAIWSDLISVAYYLNGMVLWEQVETTSKGTVVESVTLLNMLRSVVYVTATYMLVKNIAGILEVTLFSRVKFSKGTPHTITAVLTYLIVTVGGISAFSSLGISWSKIQWIFTALSVGLGFGVREIFGSFVSGTILLFERPIRVGDKVTVGNFSGVISRIRLRSTTLLNDENKEVVLPNQVFVTDRFINWTLNNTITRLQVEMKISNSSDLNQVRELLFQAAEDAPKILKEPAPNVNLVAFGEGWIEHQLNVYVAELDDRSETLNFLYQRIDELFKQYQIKIAFKQVDVHLYNA